VETTGRPPKYKNADDLKARIKEYFDKCDDGEDVTILNKKGDPVKIHRRIPYTLPGLALHLGFASRQAFTRYKAKSLAFRDIISRARTKIEEQYNIGGLTGDYNPKVATFLLGAVYDYSEKKSVELTGKDGGPVELKKILDETDGSTRGLPTARDITSRRGAEKSTGYLPTSNDGDDPGAEEGGAGSGTDQGKPGKSVKGR